MKNKSIAKNEGEIKNKTFVKSPLRYPGGKSRAIKDILPMISSDFEEFREPMVGGGSVFLRLKQMYPKKKFWINDINKELFLFWRALQSKPQELVKRLSWIIKNRRDGKRLYIRFNGEVKGMKDIDRAVRFFLLNRITFSGLSESGGYSEESFNKRFTKSSILRLGETVPFLKKVSITNRDYEEIVQKEGKKVFIFLDPPYLSKTKSKLYGKNGKIHEEFDHERFARIMKKCKHKWLITYDDSPEIRKLFKFANIYPWKLQYGMNNYKQKEAKIGKELFITNFKIKNMKKKIEIIVDTEEEDSKIENHFRKFLQDNFQKEFELNLENLS